MGFFGGEAAAGAKRIEIEGGHGEVLRMNGLRMLGGSRWAHRDSIKQKPAGLEIRGLMDAFEKFESFKEQLLFSARTPTERPLC